MKKFGYGVGGHGFGLAGKGQQRFRGDFWPHDASLRTDLIFLNVLRGAMSQQMQRSLKLRFDGQPADA